MFFLKRIRNSTRIKLSSTLFPRPKSKGICCRKTDISVLPTQAQVIICGAGSVANSVAYHLIENGWSDVVLIDKGRFVFNPETRLFWLILTTITLRNNYLFYRTCEGTSHFGSGTLGLFKPIEERNIILYSIKLYRKLQAKGFDIGWYERKHTWMQNRQSMR